MTPHPTLVKMLRFIETYQRQRPEKPTAEIVRDLRAYTKPGYATTFWELVAGDNPEFISGELDNENVVLASQAIDFAHFIAALSDQFVGGNLISTLADGFFYLRSKASGDLPYDSREFTAAIGDTAQPIEIYLSKYGNSTYNRDHLAKQLQGLASDKDYASDILAFGVGRIIRADSRIYVSDAIARADAIAFSATVQDYLQKTLGATIDKTSQKLSNLEQVKARIRSRISTYLIYKHDVAKKSIFNANYRQTVRAALIEQAAEHLLDYLRRMGAVKFG